MDSWDPQESAQLAPLCVEGGLLSCTEQGPPDSTPAGPPELGEDEVLLFKSPRLWKFVIEIVGKYYNSLKN